jgi:hypothetical protein
MKIRPKLFAVDDYVYLIFKSFEFVETNIHNIARILKRIAKMVRFRVPFVILITTMSVPQICQNFFHESFVNDLPLNLFGIVICILKVT